MFHLRVTQSQLSVFSVRNPETFLVPAVIAAQEKSSFMSSRGELDVEIYGRDSDSTDQTPLTGNATTDEVRR